MVEKIGLAATMDMGNFNKGMSEYSKGLDQAGAQTQKTGGIIQTALGMISGKVILSGIKAVANGLKDMAQEAASMPAIAGQFERLGGSIEAMRSGSAGMITDVELMKSFNQAASLVSVDFAKKLPDAMSLLGRAAAASGQDVGFMLDSLVKGVGRVSPMILDNLGIQVNLSEATEAYAASIGKSVKELSKEEQQTAVMTVVMEKLQASYGGMEDVSKSAQAQMAAFGIQLKNFKTTIGVAVLPILTAFMGGLSRLAGLILPKVTAAIEKLKPAIQSMSSFISGVFDAISGTGGDVPWEDMFPPWLANTMYTLSDLFSAIGSTIGYLSYEFSKGTKGIEALGNAFETVYGESALLDKFIDAWFMLTPILTPIADTFQAIGTTLGYLFFEFQKGSSVLEALGNAFETVYGESAILDKVIDAFFTTIYPLKPVIESIGEAFKRLGAGIGDAAKLLGKGDFIGAFKKVSETFKTFGGDVLKTLGTIDWKGIWEKVKTALVEAIGKIGDFAADAWPKVKKWFEDTAKTVGDKVKEVDWKEVWERVKTALADVAGAVGDFATKAWAKIKAWFTATATEIGNKIKEVDWAGVWQKTKEALAEAASKISDAGQRLGAEIAKWFESAKLETQNKITGMDLTGVSAATRDRIVEVMAAEKVETLGKAISDWIVNATKWLESNLAPTLEQFAKTVTAIAVKLQAEQGKEGSPVSTAFGNAFVAILKASWSLLTSPILWEAFWQVFLAQLALTEVIKQRIRDKVEEIGRSIIEGIVSGVESMASRVAETIEDWVTDNIINPVTEFLGIKSPSKVMIEIGKDIGLGLAIGIEAGSDSALKAVLGMTDSIVDLVQGMIDAISSMATAPATGNLSAWGAAIADTLSMIIATLTGMYDYAGGPKAGAIDLTRRLAKSLQDVTSFLSDVADAVGALAEVELSKVTAEKIAEFMARTHDILQAIVTESATWGATDAEIKANFAGARKLTDQILDVVRIVTPSVEAINAIISLSAFSVDDLRKAMYKWSWVETAVLYIVQNISLIAARMDMTGYAAAIELSDTITKVIGVVGPAVSAITALAGTVLADLEGAAYKWSWVITGALVIANNLKALAVSFDAEAYKAAIEFSESVSKVLGVVSIAVDALGSLTKVEFPSLSSFGAMAFGLQKMLEYIKAVFVQWQDELEKLAGMATFSEDAQRAVGIIGTVVDSLLALGKMDFPSLSSFGAMAFGLQKMLEYIKAVFVQWEADLESMSRMAIFSEGAQKVVDLIKPVIDALKALVTIEFPSLSSFGTMAFGLQKALEYIEAVFRQWEEKLEELAQMGTFSENAQKALSVIKAALEAITALASYEGIKGLPTKVLNFAQDLDSVLAGLRAVSERWVIAEGDTFTTTALTAIGVFSTNVQAAVEFIKPAIDAIKALAEYAAAKGLGAAIAAFKVDLGAAITALGELAANPLLSVEALGLLSGFSGALIAVIADLKAAVEALSAIAGYKSGAAVTAFRALQVDLQAIAVVLWQMSNTAISEHGMLGAATQFEAAAIAINGAVTRAFELLGIVGTGGTDVKTTSFATDITGALRSIQSASQALRNAWVSNWGDIAAAIRGATQALREFKTNAATVPIAPALEGHSPPPLANWMQDIADATRRAKEQLSQMAGGMRSYALPSTVAAAQAASAVANNVNVNMGGVNIHNGMDQALFEARVRRIVKEAIRA